MEPTVFARAVAFDIPAWETPSFAALAVKVNTFYQVRASTSGPTFFVREPVSFMVTTGAALILKHTKRQTRFSSVAIASVKSNS